MKTSIFNRLKPVSFIIVFGYVLLLFVLNNYSLISTNLSIALHLSLNVIIYFLSVVLAHYVVSKNKLSVKNNYTILLLSLFVLFFPEILKNTNVLCANLCLIIALKQLFAIKPFNIKKRIFDASFFIGLAILFVPWAVIFFLLIVLILYNQWNNDIKNIIIPVIGISTVFILLVCFNILKYDAFLLPSNFNINYSFNFSNYLLRENIFQVSILTLATAWSLFVFPKIIFQKLNELKSKFTILIATMVMAVTTIVFISAKNGSEFLFLLFPVSIFIANYLEIISKSWIRELLLWILIFVPIATLFL